MYLEFGNKVWLIPFGFLINLHRCLQFGISLVDLNLLLKNCVYFFISKVSCTSCINRKKIYIYNLFPSRNFYNLSNDKLCSKLGRIGNYSTYCTYLSVNFLNIHCQSSIFDWWMKWPYELVDVKHIVVIDNVALWMRET